MPKTGKYSNKRYACTGCGKERQIGTNHWGEVYPFCGACNRPTVWECLEPMPEGYSKPAPWRTVKLGDLMEVR